MVEQHPFKVMVEGSSPSEVTEENLCGKLMRGRLSAVGRRGEADIVGSAKQNSFDNAGWCNGSTSPFGGENRGSIPCPAAKF